MTSAKLPRQTGSSTPVQATEQVYAEWLATLKQRIQEARLRAAFAANAELVKLYWQIGNEILQRQQQQGWGAKVVDRLAKDLKKAFPEMKGFSRANLMYMRTFAATWSKDAIVQQAVGQLPWGHNLVLLEQLDSNEERLAYARLAVEYGWSRNVLVHHIDLHQQIEHGGDVAWGSLSDGARHGSDLLLNIDDNDGLVIRLRCVGRLVVGR